MQTYNRACLPVNESKLSGIFKKLRESILWAPIYADDFYQNIIGAGFNSATIQQAFVLAQIVEELGPITVRGCLYRAVHTGVFPGTDRKYYGAAQRIVLKLRRSGCASYGKIVDSTRTRTRPSCWNGIGDFMDTVANAYRLDFWSRQKAHVEVFVEKDAMAGVLRPITDEHQVHLTVTRGFCSETTMMDVARYWNKIEKPIVGYYLGDHDPAGLDIERDLRSKLEAECGRPFHWERLAINQEDFSDPDISGFPVKKKSAPKKWKPYVEQFGDRCVEVDAINPKDIRERLRRAIETNIDMGEWERLKAVEELEKESVREFVLAQKGAAT